MARFINSAVALLVITLVSACGLTLKVKPTPHVDALPATTKTPIHAGVYYSPEFSKYEYARAIGPHTWVIPIGAASERLFDNLYPRVFEKTSRVSMLPTDGSTAQGVDVVIAPTLEHFDFRSGLDADSDRYSVSYRTTLYTNRGVPLASWIVFGNAPSRTMGSIDGWIEDDMTDAAAKFLDGFERNAGPALAAIAKNPEGQAVPSDVSKVALTAKRAQLPGVDPKVVAALQEGGVVTLQVTALSQTEGGLVVRASDMRLRLTDGQVLEPSSVSSVLGILEHTSQAGGVVAALTNAPFGVLTMYLEERSKQNERELQFRAGGQSLFEDRTLSKGKQEAGIVLFHMTKGKGTTAADGATLSIWVVDPPAGNGALITLAAGLPGEAPR